MKRGVCVLILALAVSAALFAHPHMSLESRVEFEYAGKTCSGFVLEWTFDAFFSASIISETDANRDGKLSAAESEKVRGYAFVNLRKYGYFTYVRSGEKRVSPDKIERFEASIRGDRLVYRFFVPLPAAVSGGAEDLSVAIFDTTYFCAVSYPVDAATVRQAEAGAALPRWERGVNKKYPVYYNPTGAATDGTVYEKWKPGLETAYPEEIRVRF